MVMVTRLLNRQLEVWRGISASDGAGGWTATLVQVSTLPAMVCPVRADEQTVAQASGVDVDHRVYLASDADVCRGDQLRGDGQVLVVVDVIAPSRPAYRRADCRLRQARESQP
ncbi:MAG: head-tail adaptor protein [Micromonosporaceae bacterium]|nr:head-tail adaptor protein [Micromonosporaceae bacterium]